MQRLRGVLSTLHFMLLPLALVAMVPLASGCVGNKRISREVLKTMKTAAIVGMVAPLGPRYNADRQQNVGNAAGWSIAGMKTRYVRSALDAFQQELVANSTGIKWLKQERLAAHEAYRALKLNVLLGPELIAPTGMDRLEPLTFAGMAELAEGLDVDMVVHVDVHYYLVYMNSAFSLDKQDHSLKLEMNVTGYDRKGKVVWNKQGIYSETDETYYGRSGTPDDFEAYATVVEDLFRNGGKALAKRTSFKRGGDERDEGKKSKKKKKKKKADGD